MYRQPWQVITVFLVLALAGCGKGKASPTPLPGGTPLPLPATAIPVTATAVPTARPPATAQPLPVGAAGQALLLDAPLPGSAVSNPFPVRGRALLMPFEGTLVVRAYDARGQLAAQTPVQVHGDAPGPVSFETTLLVGGVPGAGRVEVVDLSAQDGAVRASAGAAVTFSSRGYIEAPVPLTFTPLPIHLLARAGQPGQPVKITVSWEGDVTPGQHVEFAQPATPIADANGRGLIIATIAWPAALQTPLPATQKGSLRIHDASGALLAYQPLAILHPQDAGVMSVNVYWVVNEQVTPETIHVPRTLGIGRAALNALLWGPPPGNAAGYTTAIPAPEEVLRSPRRGTDWGERVQLKDLKIVNGVAYADFSKELLAYSNGATRVLLIRQQIEQTLLQFSTVNSVVITVEGQAGLLEP